jgi:hypothetical protein
MKQSECDIYLRLSLSAVSLSLLQLPLYHKSKFKTIAIYVDNSIMGDFYVPGPCGNLSSGWIKYKTAIIGGVWEF